MSFFIDTNVFVYAIADGDEARRSACAEVLRSVAGGADGFTSTLVIEELWHLELSGRLGSTPGLAADAAELAGALLPISGITMERAFGLAGEGLGSADRIHVATCLEHGLEALVSADRGFDRANTIRRVDPLDSEELARLGAASLESRSG